MGRGAFARYPLVQGQVVAPAPLQAFRDRAVFAIHNYDDGTNNGNNKNHSTTEQLLLNYALQPKHSKMVFFPYGQGVALVNHNHYNPNVKWQWSQHPEHHASWLNLSKKSDFWKVAKPGGLILELVALRDIDQGEELLVDYGPDWDAAWQAHVAAWKPPSNEPSATYAYPADMDETLPLRTSNEQLTNPYPSNLLTSCVTGDWSDRSSPPGRTRPWREVRLRIRRRRDRLLLRFAMRTLPFYFHFHLFPSHSLLVASSLTHTHTPRPKLQAFMGLVVFHDPVSHIGPLPRSQG